MKGVIIADGYRPEMSLLLHNTPSPLLRIADKPIIFHILDFFSEIGISKCEIVLHYLPQLIEEQLENGSRWNIKITYHLIKNVNASFQVIKHAVSDWGKEKILLALGDILPKIDYKEIDEKKIESPQLWMLPDNTWSGWGIITPDIIANLPQGIAVDAFLKDSGSHYSMKNGISYFSTATLPDYKLSNQSVLQEKNQGFHFPATSRNVEEGIWISRGVSIHPTAKIIPPTFIGEDSQIEENAVLGPLAIVESNCIIGSKTEIKDSVVMQNTLVGGDLTITDSIIDKNLLINLSLGTSVHIGDFFLLGDLSCPNHGQIFLSWIERASAFILFALLSPIYLYLKLSRNLIKTKKLVLPASNNFDRWTTFDLLLFEEKPDKTHSRLEKYLFKLPMLINVIKGDVHFVGLPPRTIEEVKELPPDWAKLYLKTKVGLVTQLDVDYHSTPYPNQDECFASEVYYAVQMNNVYDFKLMMRWIAKKLRLQK